MIFIYFIWVSTQVQWSVDLYERRKEIAQMRNNTQKIQKYKIHKPENKNTKKT